MTEIEYNPKSYRMSKWLSRLSDLFHLVGFFSLLCFVAVLMGSAGVLGHESHMAAGFDKFSVWMMGACLLLGVSGLWLGGTIENYATARYPYYSKQYTPDWAKTKKSETPDD